MSSECSICYTTINDSNRVAVPCSHPFCFSCIATYLYSRRSSCPVCRQELVSNKLSITHYDSEESTDYDEDYYHDVPDLMDPYDRDSSFIDLYYLFFQQNKNNLDNALFCSHTGHLLIHSIASFHTSYLTLYAKVLSLARKVIQNMSIKGLNKRSYNINYTPVLLAAVSHNLSIVDMLLKRQVDINVYLNNGNNLLHILLNGTSSIFKPQYKHIITHCIENMVSINSPNNKGFTPLYYYILNHSNHLSYNILNLLFLINNGANIHVVFPDGSNLFELIYKHVKKPKTAFCMTQLLIHKGFIYYL